MSAFQRAERRKARARIGLVGPAGSGKTYSALQLAFGLGGRVAVIDTEHSSAELYSTLGEYDVAVLAPPFSVEKYLALIHEAEAAGYDVIVLDSLSHAWSGSGGLLDEVDRKSAGGNKFTAWRDVTPKHNALVDAILQSPAHIIATMRAKTEYVVEQDERGKSKPRKVGLAPVQREGMDYEFTLVFDVEQSRHIATTSKDRTGLFDGFADVLKAEHGQKLAGWLAGGTDAPVVEPAAPAPPPRTKAGIRSMAVDLCGDDEKAGAYLADLLGAPLNDVKDAEKLRSAYDTILGELQGRAS